MTDALLQRLRAATEGVTEGPWYVGRYFIGSKTEFGFIRHVVEKCWINDKQGDADYRFIAAARTLIPDAADRIAALEAEVARLREANANLQRICQHYEARLSPRAALGGAKP